MEDHVLTQDEAVELLAALGVEEILFQLDGSGDDGDCTLGEIRWTERHPDGKSVLTVDLDLIPHLHGSLLEILKSSAAEWPDGNWTNNEGGCGPVAIRPWAKEHPVEIDMDYRCESDHGGDFDEEDELGADLEVDGMETGADDAPGQPVTDGAAHIPTSLTIAEEEPDSAPARGRAK